MRTGANGDESRKAPIQAMPSIVVHEIISSPRAYYLGDAPFTSSSLDAVISVSIVMSVMHTQAWRDWRVRLSVPTSKFEECFGNIASIHISI